MKGATIKCTDCEHNSKVFKKMDSGGIECAYCKYRPDRNKDYSWFVDKTWYTEEELLIFLPDKCKY